ncbi:MAG: LCP family protein [Anaerolineales bacterium]|nr:LCP family protein [Anaerolineales bacterium]
MRQLQISLLVGGLLGLLCLGLGFAGLSVAHPGWLREVFSAAPTRVPAATLIAIVDSGGDVPADITPHPTSETTPVPTNPPLPTAASGPCGGPAEMTIALLGMDTRDDDYDYRARTDAITLIHVNFLTNRAAMFSIPRDLYVPLPNLAEAGIDQSRINTAYLYGEIYGVPGGGPVEFKQTVELNFGLRVDRYVLINFAAFKATIDAVGGIEVDVPTAIYDEDFPADEGDGTLLLDIPAGPTHMDGALALRYARTRHQDDDYHRIQRQQLVLLALRDKLAQPSVIPQIPAIIAAVQSAGRTDLGPDEIAALACLGPHIDRSAITTLQIDGAMIYPYTTESGGRVSIPNRDLIAPVVQQFLHSTD